MSPSENDALKKKILELEKRINTVSHLVFSYIQAIIAVLNDKELTNPDEIKHYLEKHRKELSKIMQDAQFRTMMKDIFPKNGGSAPDGSGGKAS